MVKFLLLSFIICPFSYIKSFNFLTLTTQSIAILIHGTQPPFVLVYSLFSYIISVISIILRISQHSPEQDQRNLDTLFLLTITLAAQRITNKICKNNKDIYIFFLFTNPNERLDLFEAIYNSFFSQLPCRFLHR